MMVILVILLVLQTVLSASSNHPVSAEECHVVACVKAIMASYFTPGHPTAVVISGDADSSGLEVNTPPRSSSGGNYTNMRIVLGRSHKENIHQNAFSNLQGINTRQSEFIFEHHINNFQHYLCDYHLPDFMMQALSQEARWPFVIVRLPNNKIKPQLYLEPHEQYLIIIIGRMESEVISALRRIIAASMPLHTQGRFIVILTNEFLQNKVLHLETLTDLTDHLSRNAVIIVPNSQYNSLQHHNHTAQVLDLYSWFPAGTGKYCGESRQLARINQWRINGDGRFLTKHNLFPSITPTDIHGCTLTVQQIVTVSTAQFVNLEKLIVNAIANSLRAHVTFVERLTDAHIILGGIPLNTLGYPKHTLFHLSHPYFFTTLKWYATCPKPIPRQGNFVRVFTWSLWLALSIVCLLTALAFFWLHKRSDRPTTLSECFLIVWSATLGLSVPQMPRICRLRMFLLTVVCYSLAIGTVFQAFFTTFLVDPGVQKQSLQDLISSGINCHFTPFYGLHWCYNSSLCSLCSQCNDTTCVAHLLEPNTCAALASEPDIEVMLPYLRNRYPVCPTTDETADVTFTMFISKRSLISSAINTKMRRFIEVGIVNKLKTDSVLQTRNQIRSERHGLLPGLESPSVKTGFDENARSSYESESEYFIFTLTHLQVVFFMLFIGYGFSCSVLLAEILQHKIRSS
jgi:hypothetical protein